MKMESDFPDSVQEIINVIGRNKALILAGMANGCLYVPQPRRMTPDHWIAQTIGHEAAMELSKEFPGFILKFSTCRYLYRDFRNRTFWRLSDEGWSKSEIAVFFRITERHVGNILKQAPGS